MEKTDKDVNQNKHQKYRMVALDLDGTLLGADHQLSNDTVEYMRYLHKKGFVVSIATGRSAACTFDQVSHLQLSYPNTIHSDGLPVICSNGACGIQIKVNEGINENENTNEIVRHNGRHSGMVDLNIQHVFYDPLSIKTTQKALEISVELGHLIQYYVGNEIFANPKTESNEAFMKKYSRLTGKTQIICDDSFEKALEKGAPSKLLVVCGEDKVDEVYARMLSELHGLAHVVRGSPAWFVEILNPNVCKGNGLKQMAKSLNVNMNEIIAFGDGDNDLEFLTFAGKGIAMKNARENVKLVADHVCEWTNVEDGVIRTLQKFEKDGLLYFPSDE